MVGDSWVQKEWEASSHKDLGLPLQKVQGIAAQRKNLLDVFPERRIQAPSDKGEHAEK
jgi:hypothetical protein